jgi:hypothetical protein
MEPENFTEKEILEEAPEYLTINQSISLLLLKEGEKPGVLVMSSGEEQREFIDAFCRKFGYEHRNYPGFSDPGVFVARDEHRFQILEESSGGFYGAEESDVGKFLGYEKDSREYYDRHAEDEDIVRQEFLEELDKMKKDGEVDEDCDLYLELVSYVPYPDREHISDAIELGKQRYEMLESMETGKKFLKELEDQLNSEN